MAHVTTECRVCRCPLEFAGGVYMLKCPACTAQNARPKAEGLSLDVLRRANRQRLDGDFHNAEVSYQQVLLEHDDEHEAHWGLALCRYGVEYVEDSRTHKRLAVVHTTRRRPMQTDPAFRQACELAPEEIRRQYEADAAYIDQVQQEIRRKVAAYPPYDVFLCHKTTVLDGEGYSEDYRRAKELNDHLTGLGLRVFFAPDEMKRVAGANYEAAIYHALNTAKVMLLVCSSRAHLMSPWVQNEWKRFLEMADESGDKHLIPLIYADMPVRELPRDISVRNLQALRMGDPGALEQLVKIVGGYLGRTLKGTEQAAPAQTAFGAAKPVRRPRRTVQAAAAVNAGQVITYTAAGQFDVKETDHGLVIMGYKGSAVEVSIPPMIGGKPVVAIGKRAFSKFTRDFDLVSITMPPSVVEIHGDAFFECEHLLKVDMPGVKRLGEFVFCNCRKLSEILLPDGLTCIGDHCFSGCEALKDVVLPESLKEIGDCAFQNCSALKEIDLPPSVVSVGKEAFAGCDNLTYAALPEGCSRVSRKMFSECGALKEVVLPASVREIDVGAFYHCPSLREIALPDGLERIGYAAFDGCFAGPKQVTPAGVKAKKPVRIVLPAGASIEGNPFRNCESLILGVYREGVGEEYVLQFGLPHMLLDEQAPAGAAKGKPELLLYAAEEDFEFDPEDGSVAAYSGPERKCLRIPPMIDGTDLMYLLSDFFCTLQGIVKVVVPEGFYTCAARQFENSWRFENRNKTLEEIHLPKSLIFIAFGSFMNLTKLRTITIPDGIEKIDRMTFYGCTSLESVHLPDSIKEIKEDAFHGCKALREINIPRTAKVAKGAFKGCSKLPVALKLKLAMRKN